MSAVEDVAIAAATSQMRLALMATGGVTLDQVDRYAEPLARAVVGAAAPILIADAEKRGAEKATAETIMGGQRYAVVWALRRAAEDWRANATPGDDEDIDAVVARQLDARADRIQAGGDR